LRPGSGTNLAGESRLADVDVVDTGRVQYESVVIFPTFGRAGITGELFWARVSAPAPKLSGIARRMDLLSRHERLIDAVRAGDIDGVVKGMSPAVQTSVRDYVSETQPLTELDGVDALRDYLDRFFEIWRVLDIKLVNRHVDDWYVFTELMTTLEAKRGPRTGQRLEASTAEYLEYGPDGLVLCRIGHGTDLYAVA
jgi:hypothetical protein